MINKVNEKSIVSVPITRRYLKKSGIIVSVLIIWNGVCDYIYGYSPDLDGFQYFSEDILRVIETANGRPHWMILLAQTAGWLYPIYALLYIHWWVGTKKAGFWLSTVPIALLAYSILMIGGIQHAGWAFLSVLEQAKSVVGSTDPVFFQKANEYIWEHFAMGDLSAGIAMYVGSVWLAISILTGKTEFPRWFVLLSPFGALILPLGIGVFIPAPIAGYFIALFGTWFMFIPSLATTIWFWKRGK